MTKAERLAIVHERAMKRFNIVQEAVSEERMQCLADRRFYSIPGAQWEGSLAEQFENKPKFEVNKIHLSVMRIINEYRNNRITVDFVSRDGSDSTLSDACDGLFRADEQDSTAEEAYDNGFEEAVGGGFGAIRLRAVYEDDEDDDNDDQRIKIEPIVDADSCVFFDIAAERQDKADSKFCFVLKAMSPDDYEEQWGEQPTGMERTVTQSQFDWITPDTIYIAEYYEVEEKRESVRVFVDLLGEETTYNDLDEETEAELIATGSTEVKSKTVTRKRVHKYLISGAKTLSDEGYIAGKCIPIIPIYGKRWYVDGVERCMGHVRLAKDAQRLKNMQLSKLGEISALSPIPKPILTPEQVAGHEYKWADDNLVNRPYMLVNSLTDGMGNPIPSGPLAYTQPPQIPPALGALLQITEQDIKEILGSPAGQDQVVSNISGKAVEMIQSRMDMQTFIYVSNFAKALRRLGEVWLSMARELYVRPGRKMKSIDIQGGVNSIELAKPMLSKEGLSETENDLTEASFDVAVDVGPSSTSRREATVRAITGMMTITQDPETSQVLQAMAMLNMEGEGISEVREYFRKKLVKMGVIKPSDEEKKEMAADQKPDSNAIALEAMADQAKAEASKARADVVKTIAETEKVQAETEYKRAQTIDLVADVDMRTSGV